MSGLRNKVVIITGASSGIGAATAVEFAGVGAKVVLTARRRDKLEETAEKCRQAGLDGSKVLIVTGDILKDEDLQKIVDATVERFGGVDILVNNAGNVIFTGTMTSSVADMDEMYRIHVMVPYKMIKLVLPYLLRSKGNVVNISSVASHRPFPDIIGYTVAKAAQDQMMKAAALELGKDGVRLNSVCTGFIRTDLLTSLGMTADEAEQMFSEDEANHPLKRLATLSEVAKAIVFLASDDASFVSGVNLPVDSGRYNTSWIPASRM